MNHYAIAALSTFLTSIFLTVFVFFNNREKPLNRVFIQLSLVATIYGLAFFITCTSKNGVITLFFGKVTMFTSIMFAITYLHLSLIALEEKISKKQLIFIYSIGITYALINFSTNLILRDPRPAHGIPMMNRAVILYIPSIMLFLGIVIYTAIRILKGMRKTSSVKRNQLKYFIIAPIIGIVGGSSNFIVAYDFSIYPINPFAGYLVPLFSLIIAYAILKHNLLDINIVFRKTLIYSLIISFLFTVSVLTLFILVQFFGGFFPQKTFWSTLFLVIILSLLFQPVYRRSTSLVDRMFFKGTLPKIYEELQRSEKLAVLGILASSLAHEIKNPLAPVKTYIQNLPKNLNNPQFIDKITKIIPEEVDKITDIINQLRDFANPPPLSFTRVNIHNIIDKRLNLLEQDLSAKNIVVERHYSPSLSEINADSIQLERVFLNLFLNAIDAYPGSPNGGKIAIITEESGNQVIIKIQDTGVGISKEDLPHIFDPFYSKGKHKGTGLGLAITHQIIGEHKGVILVESTQGKGTTFTINLPK